MATCESNRIDYFFIICIEWRRRVPGIFGNLKKTLLANPRKRFASNLEVLRQFPKETQGNRKSWTISGLQKSSELSTGKFSRAKETLFNQLKIQQQQNLNLKAKKWFDQNSQTTAAKAMRWSSIGRLSGPALEAQISMLNDEFKLTSLNMMEDDGIREWSSWKGMV